MTRILTERGNYAFLVDTTLDCAVMTAPIEQMREVFKTFGCDYKPEPFGRALHTPFGTLLPDKEM